MLNALTTKGLAKILAEPNLLVKSGQEGNFLAGSRIPYNVLLSQGGVSTSSIVFETVGIKIKFKPEVMENGVISLKIDPAEVSSISGTLAVNGYPIIDTRDVRTTVDLKDGESLILAGLLQEEEIKTMSKIPLLGDIPILGALFRSTQNDIKDKELVFFITPKIVKPNAPGVKTELPTDKKITPEQEKELKWMPTRRLKRINNKGVALVFIALMIVVLVAFVSLAVDLGYMYVAKGQLQNAADAAALAGASQLPDQVQVKLKATQFAAANKAVGDDVAITNADIEIGNWDPTRPRTPNDLRFSASGTIKNAVKVTARRNVTGADAAGQGAIPLFFGRIFSLLPGGGAGWSEMGTKADAIAATPPRATGLITMCNEFCDADATWPNVKVIDPPRVLETGPTAIAPNPQLFGWTSLLTSVTAPGFSLNDLICNWSPFVEVCGQNIYTTMGGDTTVLRDLEGTMYDPGFDSVNKEKDADGKVIGWWLIVPITETCPPGLPGGWDPKQVIKYAKIHISAINSTGVGNPCRKFYAPKSVKDAYSNNVIVIDRLSCVACADKDDMLGVIKYSLVK